MEFSPSLISHQASVDVKQYLLTYSFSTESSLDRVSEEVRGVLPSLISLMVSVDVKPHL